MRPALLRGAGAAVLAAVIAGCAPAAPTAAPLPPVDSAVPQQPAAGSAQAQPTPLTAVLSDPTLSPPTVGAGVPGRPSAPAGINDDFRPDPVSVIAATGRPQLIEFFAFW